MSTIANALNDKGSQALIKRTESRAAQFAALQRGERPALMDSKENKVVLLGRAETQADGTIVITLPAPDYTAMRVHEKSDCVTYSVDFSQIKVRAGQYMAPFSASRPSVINVFVGNPMGDPELLTQA